MLWLCIGGMVDDGYHRGYRPCLCRQSHFLGRVATRRNVSIFMSFWKLYIVNSEHNLNHYHAVPCTLPMIRFRAP